MKQKTYKAILTILDPEENTMDEKEYELDIKEGSLNDIEASVSNFRNRLLPNVELSILDNEQKEYLKKKPAEIVCNGINIAFPVWVRNMNISQNL